MVCVASMLMGDAVVRLIGGPDDGADAGVLVGVVDNVVLSDGDLSVGPPSSAVFFLPNPNNDLFFFFPSTPSSALSAALARGVSSPLPCRCAESKGLVDMGTGAVCPRPGCSGSAAAKLIVCLFP
jgi:hypothetical protein